MYLNISLHNDISFFDLKAKFWLIYVCIYVLNIFNISHHNSISSFDQKANVWLIYVYIYVLRIFKHFTH